MRLLRILTGLLLTCALTGCAAPGSDRSRAEDTGTFTVRTQGFPRIPVHYATAGNLSNARVIVVMHGVGRNADEYRDAWTPLIKGHDVIVVAPEFSQDNFPGSQMYNLGGMAKTTPSDEWTFTIIESVFDATVAKFGGKQTSYDMFGHSAGAQFVHRYVEFMPDVRLRSAISANAGWYTRPDQDDQFPYGLKDAPEVDLSVALQRDLIVLLGSADTGDENLRNDAGANRQGETRLERGYTFYSDAQRAAESSNVTLAWSLQVVPGTGHDYVYMSAAAARILLEGCSVDCRNP